MSGDILRRICRDAPLVAPRPPVPHICVCGRPDHMALIGQLGEAMGLDLPAIPATPAQVWEALLGEVGRRFQPAHTPHEGSTTQ